MSSNNKKIDLNNVSSHQRMIQDVVQIGTWTVDLKKEVCHWDSVTCEIHGVPAGTKTPLNEAIDFYIPEDRDAINEAVQESIKNHTHWDEKLRLKKKDGEVIWVRAIGKPILEDGVVVRLEGVFQDINSEQIKEENLRKTLEHFQLLAYSSELGVWNWNLKTNVVKFDDRWCEILGYEPNELEPSLETWRALTHRDDVQIALDAVESYLKSEVTHYEVKFRMLHKGGFWVPILAKGRVTEWNIDNEPVRFVGTHFDLSNIQKYEDDKKQEEKLKSAKNRIVSMSEMAAGVGHEINNPLAVISGNLQRIERELGREELKKEKLFDILGKSKNACERIAKTVGKLRQLTSQDNPAKKDSTKTSSAQEILNTLFKESQPLAEQNEIKIIKKTSNYTGIILADSNMVITGLRPLVKNAIEVLQQVSSPEIILDVYEKNGHAVFEISDNGPGIPKEAQSKVFDPFFTTKGIGEGEGLGASQAASTLQMEGGHIEFETVIGNGTTFIVTLPLSNCDENVKSNNLKPNTQAIASAEDKSKSSQPIALVVDDEPELREIMGVILDELGFIVEHAQDGSDALTKAQVKKYDLIITDIQMPNMDGITFVNTLAKQETKLPKILLTTGGINIDLQDENLSIHKLIDGFIYKPFTVTDIEAIILKLFPAVAAA